MPEVIPFAKSAPSARTVIQAQDAQGKAITFDTDTALVAWGAPGFLVYIPDPMACGYPAYLYDVTHPVLVKRILEARNPWDYVRPARYNYFDAGCNGDWGGSHRGTIVFSHQDQTIGEAAFEFKEGNPGTTYRTN